MQRWLNGIFIGIVILFCSCSKKPDAVVMNDVNISDWSKTTTLVYNNTTIGEVDMSIVLHVNRVFSAEEIALQITMFTPDSLRYTEQVTLPIELKPERPTQAATDIEIPYRRNVEFRRKGEYIWQITPTTALNGVEAAGLSFYIKD